MYINLKRIEFVITEACSGRCRHCSNGESSTAEGSVDAGAALKAIKRLAEKFEIESVMTFGGEPLLHADTVGIIQAAARDCGIPKRQIITNGYFSREQRKIDEVAETLCRSGVNDILLSVDAFHQEYIPLEPVIQFADTLVKHGVPSLRVQPAWLVGEKHNNPYNAETKRLLKFFSDNGIQASEGNIVFPSGNALKHLAQWFPPAEEVDLSEPCGSAPYTTRLDEVNCISIDPNGNVDLCSITIGNIYRQDILAIVNDYNPYDIPAARALLSGGVAELLSYAETVGVAIDISHCRSACGVCRKAMAAINAKMKEG